MSTNSLFEFEYDLDYEHGQAAVWFENESEKRPFKYRFRHLNSGRVLAVKTINKNGKDIFVLTT